VTETVTPLSKSIEGGLPTTPATSGELPLHTTSGQARYALAILFLVAVMNFIDRKVLMVLQEPVKRDLGLSDAQLGSLVGLAFAIVSSTALFPIARLADFWIRKHVIAIALLVWSALTGFTGLATGFASMVLLRMGVAAGEAGSAPASHSLITDYFPPEKRVMAFALIQQAVPIGTMFGYLAGGWLNYHFGWRGTMAILGLFGIALVPLVMMMEEPFRGQNDGAQNAFVGDSKRSELPPARAIPGLIWANRPLRYLLLGAAAHAFLFHALQIWSAPFYGRVFGLPVERVALYLAVVVGIAGGVGVWLGATIARRLGERSQRWYLWVPAIADLLIVPIAAADVRLSLIFGFLGSVVLNLFLACILVTAQSLVISTMRATVSAALGVMTGVIGLGLGPTVVGFLSDWLIANHGMTTTSLRYAILMVLPAAFLAALCFFRAAWHLPHRTAQ